MKASVELEPADAKQTDQFCPVVATLNVLSQRWTLHILRTMMSGPKRFNELSRAIGINPRTLRARLQALENDQFISRRVISTMPPNVEYSLTPKGASLNDVFDRISEWGIRWMPGPEQT